jgi:hypothetical protein
MNRSRVSLKSVVLLTGTEGSNPSPSTGESRANFIPTPKRKGKTPPRAVYRKSEMGYVELHGWRLPFGMTDEASRC